MAKSKMFTAQTIKRFTSVHSWVGIVTGMALFIAFFAGALTMYAGSMHLWANPALRQSSGSMAQVQTLVDAVGAHRASKGNFSVAFGQDGRPVASFFEGGTGRTFQRHTRVIDDQSAVVPRKTVSGIEHFINGIHYTMGLPKYPGYTLMGIVSAVYFLALVTGVLIHLPHMMADLYALRTGRNLKKMWLDAHNAIGILSLPFHIMFAFTGFLICLFFLLTPVMEKIMPTTDASAAYQQGGGRRGGGRDEASSPAARMMPASQTIAIATGRVDGLEPTGISYSGYGTTSAKATVKGHFPTALAATGSVEISPVSGTILKVDVPGARSTARVLEQGYLFLHYGDYGGQVIRAAYFILGLGGAFLFYSGNLLWIETRRKRRHAEQMMTGWVMAKVTVGICLGCCLGIAVALWGTRLLAAELADRGKWEGNLYYIGFFAAVMWATARPPIRAAIEILFACAAAYAALPLLNALLTHENLFYALRHGLWDVAVIDVLLGTLGIGFFAMGRATLRRASNGQPNSVWSLTSRPVEPRTAPAAISQPDEALA